MSLIGNDMQFWLTRRYSLMHALTPWMSRNFRFSARDQISRAEASVSQTHCHPYTLRLHCIYIKWITVSCLLEWLSVTCFVHSLLENEQHSSHFCVRCILWSSLKYITIPFFFSFAMSSKDPQDMPLQSHDRDAYSLEGGHQAEGNDRKKWPMPFNWSFWLHFEGEVISSQC